MNIQIVLICLLLVIINSYSVHSDEGKRYKRGIIEDFSSHMAQAIQNVKQSFQNYYRSRNHRREAIKKRIEQHRLLRRQQLLRQNEPVTVEQVANTRSANSSPLASRFGHIVDPIIQLTTPQIISAYGYYSESHTVITDDGYILTLHRIPFSKNSISRTVPNKTVLLHHGLFGSSADWVMIGPHDALPFILSNAGYDVWLANARGNYYSKAHVSYSVNSNKFWDFSWHEISQHDLPAIIDYIMLQKGFKVKLNYVGHSMGTTVLFALLSTKPEYNNILNAGFALAPIAYMNGVRSPLALLARYGNDVEFITRFLGIHEFLPHNTLMQWFIKNSCENFQIQESICENLIFLFAGFDKSQFNQTLMPRILAHIPAGASTKTVVHYAQEIAGNGRFQQYDYGYSENIARYGSKHPPEYPVEKITLPIALLSSTNDWLASQSAVGKLYSKLGNPVANYVVPYNEFNHLDFLFGIDAPSLVYYKLLELIEEAYNNIKA